MKVISKLLSKKVVAGSLIAMAITFPAANAMAGVPANIQADTGVANVTAGDNTYQSSVNASYDQVVKVQVRYVNTSQNTVANNVHIKMNIPNAAGASQTITTSVAGSNTNTVNGSAVVNLGRSDAFLQYEAGTTVAQVTNPDGSISKFNVPDSQSAVTSVNSAGYLVDNGNPCQGASITALARVVIPGVKVVKQVEKLGQSGAWSQTNTANPGDTLKYMITYQNIGNSVEKNVVIGDNLPPKMKLVSGSTTIYNSTFPNGVSANTDNITNGGINIGNYNPGATAYVVFEVTVPQASALACGDNQFRNVGVAQPEGMTAYYNTAITDVNNQCSTPTAKTTPKTPTTLVNTGPGDVVGIFAATTIGGALFHKLFLARRLAQRS